jgi:hypothetical protein
MSKAIIVTQKGTGKDAVLCIEIPMHAPTPSASGKSLVVATTSGNMATSVVIDGKPVIVGVNAYIKA